MRELNNFLNGINGKTKTTTTTKGARTHPLRENEKETGIARGSAKESRKTVLLVWNKIDFTLNLQVK